MHATKKNVGHTEINKLGIISLISSISLSLVITIWAIYINSFVSNESQVGFIITTFTLISIASYIFTIPLIERTNKTKLFVFTLIIYILSYLLFSFTNSLSVVIIIGIILAINGTIRVTSLGIIVRDKSKSSSVSQNIGLIYTFLNIAWVIGPLIAGFLSQRYGIKYVFLLASLFMFITFTLFKFFKIEDKRVTKKIDNNILKVLKEFFKDKNRRLNYILSGGINIWWSFIYIFIPLYIIDSGLSTEYVGYFLFAIAVPLILLEYYFGRKAARTGFKKMFFTGYLIVGIISIICFFINPIFIILLLLVLASFGMAMLEPTTEAYFFDIIKKNERDKYYGPYNTTIDINNAIGTLLGAIVLFFLPFKFTFILYGILMLFLAFISLKIKNIKEK